MSNNKPRNPLWLRILAWALVAFFCGTYVAMVADEIRAYVQATAKPTPAKGVAK